MLKISIIVPVYKVPESFLHTCIKSLLEQTYSNIEIILVEDGSPDNCGKIIDQYQEKDSRLVCIHQKNQGVSVARNNGLKKATGDYVLFVDGDDQLMLDACTILAEQIKNYPCDLMLFEYVNSSEKDLSTVEKMRKIEIEPISNEKLKDWFLSDIQHTNLISNIEIGTPWGKFFSREFLEQHELKFPKDMVKSQDRVFVAKCLEKQPSMCYIKYCGYIYNNENDYSICKRYVPNILQAIEPVGDALKEILMRYEGITEEEKQETINTLYFCFLGGYLNLAFFHPDQKLSFTDQKKSLQIIYASNTFQHLLKGKQLTLEKLKKRKTSKALFLFVQLLKRKCYLPLFILGRLVKK